MAIEEYDNDRWRIISGKVGNGFSAAACKDKSAELDGDADVDSIIGDDEPSVEATTSHEHRDAYPRIPDFNDFASRGAEGS